MRAAAASFDEGSSVTVASAPAPVVITWESSTNEAGPITLLSLPNPGFTYQVSEDKPALLVRDYLGNIVGRIYNDTNVYGFSTGVMAGTDVEPRYPGHTFEKVKLTPAIWQQNTNQNGL